MKKGDVVEGLPSASLAYTRTQEGTRWLVLSVNPYSNRINIMDYNEINCKKMFSGLIRESEYRFRVHPGHFKVVKNIFDQSTNQELVSLLKKEVETE